MVSALETRRRALMFQPHEAVASGAIASFRTDVISPLPLEFNLNPVQDLHGQANPYPPGGGKNLFPMTVDNLKTFNTNGTWNGNVYTYRNVTYTLNTDDGGNVESITVNGTATYISSLILATNIGASFVVDTQYAMTGCPSGGSASGGFNLTIGVTPDTTRIAYDTGSGASFTYKSSYQSYTYNAYIAVAQGASISSKVFTPMVRLASASSGFAPYSNICPITGHDGFTRTGTGGNLLPTFTETPTVPGLTITVNDGAITISGTISSTTTIYAPFGVFTWDGVTDCWLSGCPTGGNYLTSYSIRVDGSSASEYSAPDTGTGVRLMRHQNATSPIIGIPLRYCIVLRAGTYNNLTFTPMLNFGLSAQKYAPYSRETYTTTFPTPPGTVYGGHVKDNGDGTGTLVVTRICKNLGSLTWINNASYTHTFNGTLSMADYAPNISYNTDFICTQYKAYTSSDVGVADYGIAISNNGQIIYVRDIRYSDKDVFKNAMDGVYIVYELKTKQTYTLSLTALQSLIGQNHVWVDNADSVTVEYWGH